MLVMSLEFNFNLQAICAQIRSVTEPMFAECIGKYQIEAIEFDNLSLGTIPPEIHGKKWMFFS